MLKSDTLAKKASGGNGSFITFAKNSKMNHRIKIFLLLTLMFGVACTSTKQTPSGKKVYTDEQIEVDAYAKANLDCTYELARIEAIENPENKQLDGKSYNILLQQRDFQQKVKYRYLKDSVYKYKYRSYYNKARKFFKTCKHLDAIKNNEKK